MCKNYGAIKCVQNIKFSKNLLCKKRDFFSTTRSCITKGFSGFANLWKSNLTSFPENLTTYVKMCQLWNEPSYIFKLTIWIEQEKKTLPLLPMEKQLRTLTELRSIQFSGFLLLQCVMFSNFVIVLS